MPFWAGQVNEHRICLLAMEGTVSRTDLLNLAMRLGGLAAQGVPHVVVDARGVGHWDFRGLAVVADAVVRCRLSGTRVSFVTPSRYLRDIAAAIGLAGAFEFFDELSLDDPPVALRLVEAPPPAEPQPLRRVAGP